MGYGASLKKILNQRKMTVIELSENTGIPATTLYSIIKRDSPDINLDTLSKICDALGTDATYVLLNENYGDHYQTYYGTVHQYMDNLVDSGPSERSQENVSLSKSFDVSDLTKDELNEVKQFIEFLRSKRNTLTRSSTTD